LQQSLFFTVALCGLQLGIERVILDNLFGFLRRYVVPGEVVAVGVIPVESESATDHKRPQSL